VSISAILLLLDRGNKTDKQVITSPPISGNICARKKERIKPFEIII